MAVPVPGAKWQEDTEKAMGFGPTVSGPQLN